MNQPISSDYDISRLKDACTRPVPREPQPLDDPQISPEMILKKFLE